MLTELWSVDPQYATRMQPWDGLILSSGPCSGVRPQTLERAFALAQKALALDEALPQAQHDIGGCLSVAKSSMRRPLRKEKERSPRSQPAEAVRGCKHSELCREAARSLWWAEKRCGSTSVSGAWHLFEIGMRPYLLGRYRRRVSP